MNRRCQRALWSLAADMGEHDCACATNPSVALSPDLSSFRGDPSSAIYSLPLPDNHIVAFDTNRPGPIFVLDLPAQQILEKGNCADRPGQIQEWLLDPQPSELSELTCQATAPSVLGLVENAAPTIPPQRNLIAWLHVTNSCNLNCTYCYVPKSNKEMDESTGYAAVDAVFRSALHHGYRSIKLKYAGGEPTLSFGLIRALHGYAEQKAKQTGMLLQEVILSNGVALTDSMLDFIATSNMRLMISLDGMGTAHDGQRPFASGAPSSGLVLNAVDRAIMHGVKPCISITVSPRSARTSAEPVTFALDRDLAFNLNLLRTGLSQDGEWESALITGLRAALAIIEARLPQRRLIDGLIDSSSFGGPRDFPCGAGRDYLVITHQGKIARCHMTLTETVSDIWERDPLAAVRSPSHECFILPASAKKECGRCAWRSVCGGGCPLLTLRTTGRSDAPSPYCNVYQAIFPELLRLEGLRILKWQRAN